MPADRTSALPSIIGSAVSPAALLILALKLSEHPASLSATADKSSLSAGLNLPVIPASCAADAAIPGTPPLTVSLLAASSSALEPLAQLAPMILMLPVLGGDLLVGSHISLSMPGLSGAAAVLTADLSESSRCGTTWCCLCCALRGDKLAVRC